jgi:hypothetical protein
MKPRHIAYVAISFISALMAGRPAAAQGSSRTRVEVMVAAPIFVLPDANRQPLRVVRAGSTLRLVEQSGEWTYVQFSDPDYERRFGYIQTKFVHVLAPEPSEPIVLTAPEAEGLRRADQSVARARPVVAQPVAAPPPSLAAPSALLPAAPPAHTLSDQDKADAVRLGIQHKGRLTGLSLTNSGRPFANASITAANRDAATDGTGFSLRVYTPRTWVEQMASNAAKASRPFVVDDIKDQMLEPVLRVVAYPNKPTVRSDTGVSGASSAETIVLQDEYKRTVIQPLSKEPFVDIVSSPLQELAYQGIVATFPLESLRGIRGPNGDEEFLIVLVGAGTEKEFRVTRKQFSGIPLPR